MNWGSNKKPVFIRELASGSSVEIREILENESFVTDLLGPNFKSEIVSSYFDQLIAAKGADYKGGITRLRCESFMSGPDEYMLFQTLNTTVKLLLISPMKLLATRRWRRSVANQFLSIDYGEWILDLGKIGDYASVFLGNLDGLDRIVSLDPDRPNSHHNMPHLVGFRTDEDERSFNWTKLTDVG